MSHFTTVCQNTVRLHTKPVVLTGDLTRPVNVSLTDDSLDAQRATCRSSHPKPMQATDDRGNSPPVSDRYKTELVPPLGSGGSPAHCSKTPNLHLHPMFRGIGNGCTSTRQFVGPITVKYWFTPPSTTLTRAWEIRAHETHKMPWW